MLGGSGSKVPLKSFDKNGAILCILSVPELVIIDLKTNIFGDNKSSTQMLCHIFSKINPDAHYGTKINTFTFYKAGLREGWDSPQKLTKWRFYVLYIRYYIPDA